MLVFLLPVIFFSGHCDGVEAQQIRMENGSTPWKITLAAVASQISVASSGRPSVVITWVTVSRTHSPKQKPLVHHQPFHISNRFSQLSNTRTDQTLLIGNSILRDVKLATPANTVKCIPGARAGNVESYLKLLAKAFCRYSEIVIHVSINDTWESKISQEKVITKSEEKSCD